MEQGIYLFNNETDFLTAIAELNNHYADKPKAVYLSKKLETSKELKKETTYLDNCIINSFMGFKKAKQIKLNVTDCLNVTYCITYNFNNSYGGSRGIYNRLNHYFRKRNQQHI